MANSVSHASLPYPIKNARFSIGVPYLDADGDPTDPTTPDTEVSIDAGAYADCTEEMTTITGSNGSGYITLTGAETNGSLIMVCAKVASGPKATVATLYPRNLPILASGTASAGAAGSITLASSITYDITGCFVRTTGGTGGGGTGGASNQARRITAYNTSTQVATVTPNWETTPDNTTTYDVLLPEGVTIQMVKALNPTTAGRTLDVSSGGEAGVDWANVGSPTTSLALTGTTIATTQKVDVETIKTQSVTCAAGVTVSPYVGSTGAAINGTNANTLSSHDPGATLGTSTLTQTQVTGGAYALNSASFAFNSGLDLTTTQKTSVTTAATAATPTAAAVTGAVGSVTGNVGGNVTGSVGSVATGGISSASFAAGAINAAAIATDAIDADALAADAVTEIQSGLATAAALSTVAGYVDTEVASILAAVDTEVAAIKAKTDQLTFTVANQVDSNALSGGGGLDAAGVRAAVGLASANLDTQLTAIDDYLDTEVAAIKAKTDNLPASPAAVGSAMTLTSGERDSIAAALLDLADAVETGITPRGAIRLMLASLAGKLSGAATATVTIRNVGDSKDRITATVDADGNRTAVTTDAT